MPSPSEIDNDEPNPRLRRYYLARCPQCLLVGPAEPDVDEGMEQVLECRGCGRETTYREFADFYDLGRGQGELDLDEAELDPDRLEGSAGLRCPTCGREATVTPNPKAGARQTLECVCGDEHELLAYAEAWDRWVRGRSCEDCGEPMLVDGKYCRECRDDLEDVSERLRERRSRLEPDTEQTALVEGGEADV